MDRRDIGRTLPLMGAGTEFLGHAVDALHDDALREPSTLPGWTRAHVVAHVARNAEALTRLATWARTGVETPMYPDRAARAAEIEASAQAPAETLRRELTSTARDLDAALAALDATTWQSTVRSALGRPLPATEVPWMRIREVWLHAVDLDAGAGLSDLPPEVVDALLDDASATLSTRDGCPSAVLAPDDREQRWQLGEPGGSVTVSGPAAAVMGWLIGRTDGADLTTTGGPLPTPPPWL
ncbi:maleylpyruvate isomerase family mycothiol-dependent enzyme [Pseudonocardia humida]|nr:maleylpyruvate isomerase family mycothiol-dependent enzyme [Pseudonocardia humida]